MPSVLFTHGWRFFFYMNENMEPPHIHVSKGDSECKYWLLGEEFDIRREYEYKMSNADRRAVRRLIFENFDYLLAEYKRIHRRG